MENEEVLSFFHECMEFVSQGFAEGGGGNISLMLWYPLKAINLTDHGYIAVSEGLK